MFSASLVGGISISEPSADLGIALAIVSSVRNVVVDKYTTIVGEIGLTGEIRPPLINLKQGLMRQKKQGFKRIIIPQANFAEDLKVPDIEIVGVSRLIEAISKAIVVHKEE